MDQVALKVSSFVHSVEEMRLYPISYTLYLKAIAVGIPLAVLLHDTAEYWLPRRLHIPIISWFARRWRQDPEAKHAHLRAIRNLLIFAFFVVMHVESGYNDATQPSDYVEQRLTSATAHRNLNNDLYAARRSAFAAADELIGEEEMNVAGMQQQRDAALRRRYLHDSRTTNK